MNEYLPALREQLVSRCRKCGGRGVALDPGGKLGACRCLEEFRLRARLHEGGVPRAFQAAEPTDYRYRGQNLASFALVGAYVADLDRNLAEGRGLYFTGRHGVGKSLLACAVLREAARRGRSVMYRSLGALLAEMTDREFSGRSQRILLEADLVAIDEMDKVYRTQAGIGEAMFDRLIRHRYGARGSVLAISNCSREALESIHGAAIISLFSEMLEDVPLVGKDYRPVKKQHRR